MWSFIQVSSEPNSRAETPESVWPELATPLRAFSHSSTNRMAGAMASAIRSAWRMFCSLWPTSEPIKAPTSRMIVGRPVSLPSALAKALLPLPGTPSSSTPRGRLWGWLPPGCSSDRLQKP